MKHSTSIGERIKKGESTLIQIEDHIVYDAAKQMQHN